VIREALKALKDGRSRFIRLSPNPEELVPRDGLMDFPMTCFSGGTLEIFIEPQYPQPRLLVVGNLPVARALVSLGKVMNYEVVAVDPDGDEHTLADAQPHHALSKLTDITGYIHPETYVVVATHGNADELALEAVLKTKPRYIGLVASQKRFQSVLEYLKEQGISETELQRIKAPAGLDIQAQQGDEIALSILAEIVQYRRSVQQAADWGEPPIEIMSVDSITIGETPHEQKAESVAEPVSGIAIDPVCLMKVEIATAKWSYEFEGTMYYFCAPGCKREFSKNPHAYLHGGTGGHDKHVEHKHTH
jgi:xanthine dehydrogenase accessory factor